MTKEYLTVGDLKEILSQYDDDLILCMYNEGDSSIITKEQIYLNGHPYFGNCNIGAELMNEWVPNPEECYDEENDEYNCPIKFLNIASVE